jgi:hypothetical protein
VPAGHPLIFIFPKGGHTDWNRVGLFLGRGTTARLAEKIVAAMPPRLSCHQEVQIHVA